MNKDEKVARIEEVMADKTLSFGCLVKPLSIKISYKYKIINQARLPSEYNVIVIEKNEKPQRTTIWKMEKSEIIGHPVMLGDVLDRVEEISSLQEYQYIRMGARFEDITHSRKEKRKPINDQSEECIDMVYALIPNE